jgi:hypothetical protein
MTEWRRDSTLPHGTVAAGITNGIYRSKRPEIADTSGLGCVCMQFLGILLSIRTHRRQARADGS